ncbi:MAG: alpha-ketoacid dehydrogenase subunit beta [Candidatus Fimivivens sp.]
MAKISGFNAIHVALDELMTADEKVVCIGEDIGVCGGAWGYFGGLQKKFGENRIIQTPITEEGATFAAGGMTYAGYRPIMEYMFADFSALAFDPIVNMAAKARYLSGGTIKFPMTFIMPQGGGGRSGSQHAQCIEAWFANVPGLKLVAPTTPSDIRTFLKAAVNDDDPVIFFFARHTLGTSEEVDVEDQSTPSLSNAAKIVKEGKDLTVIAWHAPLIKIVSMVDKIEKETGKSIEIIDPRVLVPLDEEAIYKSVRKTGRVMIAHDAPERGGFSNIIATGIMENCFESVKAPIVRVCGYNCVIPFGTGEDCAYPSAEDIEAGIRKALQ